MAYPQLNLEIVGNSIVGNTGQSGSYGMLGIFSLLDAMISFLYKLIYLSIFLSTHLSIYLSI